MVLLLLGPADENRSVAVEPGVAGLDDPAPRSPVGVVSLQLDLLATSADVGAEALGEDGLADALVVIASVQAKTLGAILDGNRASDWNRLEGRFQELHVVAVRAIVGDADRDAGSLDEERALRPLLALSVGLEPVFGPPSGAFVIAPSAASQDQSMPTISS